MKSYPLKNKNVDDLKMTAPLKKLIYRLNKPIYKDNKFYIYASRKYYYSDVEYLYIDGIINSGGPQRRVCRVEPRGSDAVIIESISEFEYGSSFIHRKTIGSYDPTVGEVLEVLRAGDISMKNYIETNDMPKYIIQRFVRVHTKHRRIL